MPVDFESSMPLEDQEFWDTGFKTVTHGELDDEWLAEAKYAMENEWMYGCSFNITMTENHVESSAYLVSLDDASAVAMIDSEANLTPHVLPSEPEWKTAEYNVEHDDRHTCHFEIRKRQKSDTDVEFELAVSNNAPNISPYESSEHQLEAWMCTSSSDGSAQPCFFFR